jgi:DNA-binding transcriptional regulator YhcF (GntR family)
VNITVDTSSPVPPFEQIRAGIAELITFGILAAETPLPSVRQLATDLGLAPGTVQHAYTELRTAGLVDARSRQSVVVAASSDRTASADARHSEVTTAARRYVEHCRRLGADDSEIRGGLLRSLGTETS